MGFLAENFMKILNLYAGIGGNRKLWGNEHQIIAVEINPKIAEVYKSYFPDDIMVIGDAHQYLLDHYKEFDFIWASPPCQNHSITNNYLNLTNPKYPDMKLYQEIIFLQHFCKGLWIIENVKPYYEPLIRPDFIIDRHYLWANFRISNFEYKEVNMERTIKYEWQKLHGFNLDEFDLGQRKDQIYRNCVHPETGLHILNCALGKYEYNKNIKQLKLFQ
jgi:DNA (cytosine-5)-methyltransferase 1